MQPILALAFLSVALTSVIATDPLLGVHPSKKHIFQAAIASDASSAFACFDGSKSIPASSINDDFCDCEDGSDEPGTSACNNSVFYCLNAGHIGAEIPSARVNDGVCDPSCCDGSDEYNGAIKCPNVCAKVGAEFKKAEQEKKDVLEKGIKVKKEYLSFAANAKASRTKQIKDLESEIRNITARIDDLTALKSEAEAYESHMNALLAQQSREEAKALLPQQLADCNTRKQELRSSIETLNSRVTQLQSILDHLMTLKNVEEGAAFEALLRDKPILKETLQRYDDFKHGFTTQSGQAVIELGVEPDVVSFESFGGAEQDTDPLALMDPCVDPTASTFRCLLKSARGLFLGTFETVKYPLIWPGWGKLFTAVKSPFSTLSKSEENELLRKDAAKVRQRLQDAEIKKREMESKVTELKQKEGMDLGPDNVWDKLVGQCIQINSFEYNYEICFLDKATQKPISGGSGTDLGKFSRWGPRAESKSSSGKYSYMMFENGAHCWNGPHRSVEVALECGAENKIISVSEPSKCEYAMKVQTPAVCEVPGGHDEL